MRGLALLATLASVNADWSVPLPRRPYPDNNGFTTGRDRAPNSVSKYDERNIDEAFRADVIRGEGCWWESPGHWRTELAEGGH